MVNHVCGVWPPVENTIFTLFYNFKRIFYLRQEICDFSWFRQTFYKQKTAHSPHYLRTMNRCQTSPRGFEPPPPRLGELCGSVNPCQELICLALYYQGLFLFSNQILVIWIPFLSRPDKTWKLADSLQLLTSGESSVVTDRYHLPATIPLQAGMINNIQLTRFLLLLYTVIENLSMVFRPRQPT